MNHRIVGIFDSGIGGISILNNLLQSKIPEFIYVADTAYLPYGKQSIELLVKRGKLITQFFLSQNITTIIVACHTSSATALPILAQEFPQINFIDMLAPTVLAAAQITNNNRVGLFATEATITSHTHKKLFKKINSEIEIIEQSCPELVPLIEAGNQRKLIKSLQNYLKPIEQANADTLILGCTHYAFAKGIINRLSPNLKLISADKEAQSLFEKVQNKPSPIIRFYISGDIGEFKKSSIKVLKSQTVTITFDQLTF